MTDTRTKVRSLFLTVLMVVSVFGGTVAFSGAAVGQAGNADLTAENQDDDQIEFTTLFYEGQEITIDGFNSNELVNVRRVTDQGPPLESAQADQVQADGSGVVTVDTEDLQQDDFFVRGQDSDKTAGFEVTIHTLDTSVDPTEVENGDDVDLNNGEIDDAETEFDPETNRAGEVLYQVDSATLEDAELKQIFQEYQPSQSLVDEAGLGFTVDDYASADSDSYDADDDEEYDDEDPVDEDGILIAFEDGQTEELAFQDVDADNYTFDVSGVFTTAEDSVDVDVVESEDGEANFQQSIYTVDQGDRVLVTIDMQDTDTARVQIGDLDDVNYEASVVVEDDDDGQVSFFYNTFSPLSGDAFVLSEESEDDGDSLNFETSDSADEDDEQYIDANFGGSGINDLAASSYDISAFVGGDETDVATLDVNPRTASGVTMWSLPEDEVSDVSELSDVYDAIDEGTLNQDTTNAVREEDDDTAGSGDAIVHQIQVSGIYGALETGTDTGETVSLSDVESLLGATGASGSGEDDDGAGAELVISQTEDTTEANADPLVLDLQASSSELTIIPDDENNSLFIIAEPGDNLEFDRVDRSEIEDLTDDDAGNFGGFPTGNDAGNNVEADFDDAFDVEFFIPEESGLASQDVSATAGFELVERTATFDTNVDDEVEVDAAADQTVSGSTSVAVGSEITVRARATGDAPFLKTQDVTVQDDGSFNATLDFTDVSQNQTFEMTIPSEGFEDDAETDGVVAPAPSATVSVNDQTSDGTSVTVASATLSEGGFVTIHDGSLLDGATFDSVRGTSDYLEPGEHSDIQVSLDTPYESSGTAIAMPHLDTNGNEAYDFVSSEGAEDGPYTSGGSAVTDSASLTVATPTPEPTPTATPEPTPTATPEPTATEEPEATPTPTDSGGQPGFGFAVAIVALVGAALLALRREN